MSDILKIYQNNLKFPILISYHRLERFLLEKVYDASGILKIIRTKSSFARFLLEITDKSLVIDHKNHDQYDNTDENLRVVKDQQNTWNSVKKLVDSRGLKCYSKYKGVTWCNWTKRKRWKAYIFIDGKQTCLGYFRTEKEAALKYNEEVIKYRGEYAVLNIII